MKPTYNSALYGILTLAYGWGGGGGGGNQKLYSYRYDPKDRSSSIIITTGENKIKHIGVIVDVLLGKDGYQIKF